MPERSRAPEGRSSPQDGTPESQGHRADPDRDDHLPELARAAGDTSSEPRWDPLDPFSRAIASLMPLERAQPASTASSRTEVVRHASLEHLFGALVKRVAWSNSPDRSSATLRLEIGAGELAGATVLITASPQELCVVLDTPPGIDLEVWKNRLSQRLASKGLVATFP